MRIAVQISGQQRYGEFFPQFVASIAAIGEADFFFHHWDGPRTAPEIAALVTTGTVRSITIEPQIDFVVKPEWRKVDRYVSSIFNLMSMTYGIREANRLRLEHEAANNAHYDFVVRARPDIRFLVPPNPAWLHGMSETTICTGMPPPYLRPFMMQDQICIARPHGMALYADLFAKFDQFHEAGYRFHPEAYFYWYAKSVGLDICQGGFYVEMDKRGTSKREDRAMY